MRWQDFIFAHFSSWVSARFGARNAAEVRQATEPATRTRRAGFLSAAATGLVCVVVYTSGISSDPISVDFVETWLSTGESLGAEAPASSNTEASLQRPGLIERLGRLQLEDVVGAIVDDVLGTVAGELAIMVAPVGTPAWRLSLAAALLGVATVSLLVTFMLHLGVARVAAVASALAFAVCTPMRVGALTVDPAFARAPILVLALYFLTLRTNRSNSRWPWVAALGLWGISAIAEPMLLCLLPGIAAFICLVERDRSRCGHLAVLTACAGGFLFGQLLAVNGVGIRTWATAADAAATDLLVTQTGMLGLVFLASAAFSACVRPTREELLAIVGWLGAMAWTLSADTVDQRQIFTAFVLTCPVVGLGMSAVLRSRPGRGPVRVVGVLCFVLPASNYVRGVDPIATLLDDREHWMAHGRALADVLPKSATVVTTANVQEPIASLWRFRGAGGRRVVELPLDVRRVQELSSESPIFVFEPTRTYMELLGFRFSNMGRVRADLSLATYLDRLPQGTLVAAATGEVTPASALHAFRVIGGGRLSAAQPVLYGVVGTVGGSASIEDANPREVRLQVAEGARAGSPAPFPVELGVRSTPRGASVDIDGETVVEARDGVTVVILSSSGRLRQILHAVERDGDLRVPVDLRRQSVSRLDAWEPCTAVGTQGWVTVPRVEPGVIGIHFGSLARSARLALYVADSDVLPDIVQADSPPFRSTIEQESFDRRDAGDTVALRRLFAAADISPQRFVASARYVRRVLAGRDSDVQPLAAVRIAGRTDTAVARLVAADDGAQVMVCTGP